MITTGTITLPNGVTISAGQGGGHGIGSDTYPVTIIGWTKSGKTLYYQAASGDAAKGSDYYGRQEYTFTADDSTDVEVATWRPWNAQQAARQSSRRRGDDRNDGGTFRPKGCKHGRVTTRGYAKRLDPTF